MFSPERLENLVLLSLLNAPEYNHELGPRLRQDPRWSDTFASTYRCHDCQRYFMYPFSPYYHMLCRKCEHKKDVSLIQSQTNSTFEVAARTLAKHHGDVVEAIIELALS